MKVITEAVLRDELRAKEPTEYYIPEGKILSPAAREYLQQRKVKILKESERVISPVEVSNTPAKTAPSEVPKAVYEDYETGAFYSKKPEHMTQLHGRVLVDKSHPRIMFRGKNDSLQAEIVLLQASLAEARLAPKLIEDLDDILKAVREIMRADVMDEPVVFDRIIGLDSAGLREHSHNPMKYYNIKQMTLPDYKMGLSYARLNRLRALVREAEVAATSAFRLGRKCTHTDIVELLNRLSSAMHIVMCKYLGGGYD